MTDLAIALIGFLIILGACWDIVELKIPNTLNIALFIISCACVAAILGPKAALYAVAFSFVMLTLGFTLFALNLWGGGDAKMLAAIAPLYGFSSVALELFFFTTMIGGALSLAFLKFRKIPLPDTWGQNPSIARLHRTDMGIPYGVAIAAAALITLPKTELFHTITALPFLTH